MVLYVAGGVLALIVLRLVFTGTWGNSGFSETWKGIVQQNRIAATIILTVLFVAYIFGTQWLVEVAYDLFISESLTWIIIGTFLLGSFLIGLVVPLREAAAIPILGHVGSLMLSLLTPLQTIDSLTYDSGWFGLVMTILVPSCILWFAWYVGRVFSRPMGQA